jgi:hypothetical protein
MQFVLRGSKHEKEMLGSSLTIYDTRHCKGLERGAQQCLLIEVVDTRMEIRSEA